MLQMQEVEMNVVSRNHFDYTYGQDMCVKQDEGMYQEIVAIYINPS